MTHETLAAQGGMSSRLQRAADRFWWAPLIIGVVWFVIAWLVLRANYTSLATVGVLVGVVFLVSAVGESTLAYLTGGGWAFLHVALAVLFVLGALWGFIRPINTFFALASVLGLLLLLQGAFYIARAVASREVSPYWGVTLTGGILIALLGIWVSTSDRTWTLGARAAFILLWVGFMAIFRGITDITLAFELRRAGRDVQKVGQKLGEGLGKALPTQRSADDERQKAGTDSAYTRGT
jgi:uncharacterized membrane protein HdeD (DUF308 family)